MENNNAPLLEMRSIKKDFFGNQVLTDISFTLREGEVLGLVGENGAGKSTPTFETGYVVRNGDIVGITIVTSGNTQRIGSLVYPDELRNVPNTAWSGKGAVTVNGRTYTVPASVPCYNTQTKSWVTLTEARAYADSATLYVYQGVVRFLEVG
jgi:ABC-type polysaccharide/polyol phosphate transport system ATPase subunit